MRNMSDYIGTYVYCVREVYTLEIDKPYKISSTLKLDDVHGCNKTGDGFSIVQELFDGTNATCVFHYFRDDEFSIYFIEYENFLRIKNRSNKLKKLGI